MARPEDRKEGKITIDQEGKKVTEVTGGIEAENPITEVKTVWVEQGKKKDKAGCPAWIVINSKKYQI